MVSSARYDFKHVVLAIFKIGHYSALLYTLLDVFEALLNNLNTRSYKLTVKVDIFVACF